MASNAEPKSDRIARWRSLAIELGVEASAIPGFIAENMTREETELARLELEKLEIEERLKREHEKSEREQKKEQERLEREQKRERERERERREKESEREEERMRSERERLARENLAFEERAEREKEEHELRKQLLLQEAARKSQSEIEHTSATDDMEEEQAERMFHVSIPLFNEEKEEIATWLKRFERVATLGKWDERTWAIRVSTRLTGKAAELYNSLDDSTAEDYEELKAALLMRYQLTAETYRQRFRSCRKTEGETYKQYCARLAENLAKWHELSKVEELKQLILLEQFQQTLSPEMSAFVKEKRPQKLSEAGDLAEIYYEAHGEGRKKFFQPGKPQGGKTGNGHEGKRRNLGQKNSAKGIPKGGMGVRSDRKCFTCGSPKHLARDCTHGAKTAGAVVREPSQTPPLVSVPTLCAPCSKQDYSPWCQVVVEGVTVKGLRDTGSQVCVVRQALVKRHQYTGEELEVSMAETNVKRRYKVAAVHIDCPFYSGEVEAVMMKSPVTDFIVGNHARLGDDRCLPVYALPRVVSVVTRAQEAADRKKRPTLLRVAQAGLGEVTPVQLRAMQLEDSSLARCREAASGKKVWPMKQGGQISFVWKKEILYREFKTKGVAYTQVVVPRDLRQGVLKLAHETPMSGHMGVQRTRERVWKHFFWPGMCPDVRRFVESCDQCQRVSPKPRKVPLGRVPLIDTPFERVAIDIVGPITPASDAGNRYILVFVDYATRYPEAIPLKTIDAVTVAEAMFQVWARVGIPAEILTDRDTQFMSDVMREVERLLAIKGLATTPYHAQGNGLVERYNSTLKTMLRKLSQERPKQWDRYIPALLFAYREVQQESLGFSPFELLYGRTVRGPMSVLRSLWTEEVTDEQVRTTSEYVVDLRNRIEETCKLAHQKLAVASQRQAAVFNRKTVVRVFRPGDKVLLLLPQKHNKLQLCWQGPFEVLERRGEADYRVRMGGRDQLYHANLLKLYRDRSGAGSSGDQTPAIAVAVIEEGGKMTLPDREIPLPCLVGEETARDVVLGSQLTDSQRGQVLAIAEKYSKVLTDLPLCTDLATFDMTVESARPVRVRQYPLPYAKMEVVKEEVKAMLALGVIEPAASPYNAPVVLVRKKDDKFRFCVDYRALNGVTVFDAEPLPDVESLFARLGHAKYFTKINLSKGYWQIPVQEDVRPMTAFTTPAGQFQFCVMPFGLKNAVAVFSRMMRALLEPLGRDDVHNFMDDILIATETWSEHLEALEAVLNRLRQANLSARPTKCCVGFQELGFLGHVVRKGEILPEDDKIQKVEEAPVPKTKKQVRAFLGLAGYYRKFIPNFSAIALPLSNLTKKSAPNTVEWNTACETAFRALKARLTARPVLQLPDLSAPFTLRTDASDTGLGAVLLQERSGLLHPVEYASRKLTDAESRYSTIERECLAVVWATHKFQPYLYGRAFDLETDHQPLRYLQTAKVANSRLMRWSLLLQVYNFTIRVIPGKQNVGADYLSRACMAEDH